MLFWPVLIIGLAIVAVFLSGPPTDGAMDSAQAQTHLVYFTLLVAALALFSIGRALIRGGRKAVLHTAIWIGAVAGIGTAFIFRDQAEVIVNEIRAELMPSVAMSRTAGEAELRRGWDGHYRADATVNGIVMRMMIDTGASMVLIPYEDVAALGIDPASLDFNLPVTTANGKSSVAPIRLSSIKVGPIAVFDIDAAVAQPGRLKTGLLGMSFLDNLSETSFQGDRLILRQGAGDRSSRFRAAPTGN